jgi:hypothetical protein
VLPPVSGISTFETDASVSILSDLTHPEGYRYSRFCELYRVWEGKLSVTMRQTHVGGDKLFVDYAGDTVQVIVERLTGEVRQTQIFVAVMAPRTCEALGRYSALPAAKPRKS